MNSSRNLIWTSAAALFFFCMTGCGSKVSVQLAGDVNRDGIVDFLADEDGEENWTKRRGAILLSNCDDDDTTGEPDHADERINGSYDENDLAVLRVARMPKLRPEDRVTLNVDPASRNKVNAFLKGPGGEARLIDIGSAGNLDKSLLMAGDTEIWLEAKSFATADWNGIVNATVRIDGPSASKKANADTVQLRVAPWIMLSSLDTPEIVYVREYPGRNDAFIEQIEGPVLDAGANLRIVPAGAPYPAHNIWMQDTMEIGYTQSTPDNRMPVVLPANRNKPLDNFAKDSLLGPDFGWFRIGEFRPAYGAGEGGTSWMDWYGNLEATPPLPGYPHGRVYYGEANGGEHSLNPEIVGMVNAQGVQGPAVPFDVSFLLIKHVDELICFVPSNGNGRQWYILVPDTVAMIEILEKWLEQGYGGLKMLEAYEEDFTVNDLAEDTSLANHNRTIQRDYLDPLYELIVSEFGVDEEALIRIPVYFDLDGTSLIPNMVNSLVLNDHLVVADPNGPVHYDFDLLEEEFIARTNDLRLNIHFVDDRQYHKWSGNVHCATNALRGTGRGIWYE